MRYADVRDYVTTSLQAKGYGGTKAMPTLDPGPPSIAQLQSRSPNAMLVVTVGNGIGFTTEGLFDRTFITVRAIGLQGDFDYAETLAYDVDSILDVPKSGMLGTQRVLSVTRNAPPQLVDYDSAGRYQFQTTYIAEAQR